MLPFKLVVTRYVLSYVGSMSLLLLIAWIRVILYRNL